MPRRSACGVYGVSVRKISGNNPNRKLWLCRVKKPDTGDYEAACFDTETQAVAWGISRRSVSELGMEEVERKFLDCVSRLLDKTENRSRRTKILTDSIAFFARVRRLTDEAWNEQLKSRPNMSRPGCAAMRSRKMQAEEL